MGLSVDGPMCQGHLEVGVIPSALLSLWLFLAVVDGNL